MNDRDQLLAETLHTDWHQAGAAAAFRAARSIRRRRRARAISAVGLGCIAIGLVTWQTIAPAPPARIAQQPTPPPMLEIISDDELLELLRDEPVLALRDARGIHAVVFLDAVRLATTND